MFLHHATWLVIALWSVQTAQAHVQVVYMTDSTPNFVDSAEQGQKYVVGFGREEGHQPPSRPHRSMLMRGTNGTSYRCYIPDAAAAAAADAGGGGSITTAAEGSLFSQKTPSELLEALAEHCYYHIEAWWTYELCYKKKLRQYHKDSGKVVSQYLLGIYAEGQAQTDEVQVDTADVSGAMRYVSQQYGEGEACELTGQPRQAEVRFTCGTGEVTLLTSMKELASCNYVATIATPRLCKHPAFQQQPKPAGLIQCHPLSETEAEAAAAAVGAGAGGHCAGGAQQRSDGTCAAGGGAAAARGGQAATAAVANNHTQQVAGLEGGDKDGSLLQSLVEGQYYEDDDDPNDPYLNEH